MCLTLVNCIWSGDVVFHLHILYIFIDDVVWASFTHNIDLTFNPGFQGMVIFEPSHGETCSCHMQTINAQTRDCIAV